MSKYPKHDATLKWAISQIGVYESPAHSNRGPIQHAFPKGGVDYFEDSDFLAGHGYPWCASFCLSAWEHGGGKPLPYKTASAYGMLNWARGAGWARSSTQLTPGDLVVFNVGSGHIAIFERWEGSYIHTVDGNHGDRVARAARPHSQVAGGIHVPELLHKPVPPPPEPFWVIATSENGHKKLVFTKFATQKKVASLLPALLAKYGKNGITIKRGGVRKKK